MNTYLESDWERVDAMTDEEIDTSDIPPLDEEFFRRARIRLPKQQVTLQIDADLLGWFRSQGEDYQRRMNTALRIYAEAHKTV